MPTAAINADNTGECNKMPVSLVLCGACLIFSRDSSPPTRQGPQDYLVRFDHFIYLIKLINKGPRTMDTIKEEVLEEQLAPAEAYEKVPP